MTKLLSIGPAELYISGKRRDIIKKITDTINAELDAYEKLLQSPEYRSVVFEKGLSPATEIRFDLNLEVSHGESVSQERLQAVASYLAAQAAANTPAAQPSGDDASQAAAV